MRILLVDDQPGPRPAIARFLARAGATVEHVASVAAARKRLGACDGLLVDLRSAPDDDDRSGLVLIREAAALGLPAVAHGGLRDGVTIRDAFAAGAVDFLVRREFTPTETARHVLQALSAPRAETAPLSDRAIAPAGDDPLANLVGGSVAMQSLRDRIVRLASRDDDVLITGETGTGKDLVARTIHRLSGRPGELVTLNVGGANGGLFESALFGHERGAFTGATRDRPGVLVEAGGGTVLLDEIGDLPLELQPRLLRVLEARRVRPIGAPRELVMNARVLFATHVDLADRVHRGLFREDLYYRLSALRLEVAPLRERREDIPALVRAVVASSRAAPIDERALRWLAQQPFPGNVRQLHNVLRHVTTFGTARDLRDVATAYAAHGPPLRS